MSVKSGVLCVMWEVMMITSYLYSQVNSADVCTAGQRVGDDLGDFPMSPGTANQGFMIGDTSTALAQSRGEVGCYGAVQYFEIRCFNDPTLREGDIEFNIWRPQPAPDFLLVGKYTHTFTCPPGIYSTQRSAAVHPWEQIPVIPGDRIGIVLREAVQLITSGMDPTCCDYYDKSFAAGVPAVDSTVSWSPTGNIRRLGFQAVLGPSTAPQWDNLPNTVHIRESVATGFFVFDARASDKNELTWAPNGDVIYYSLTHAQFNIDQVTGRVTTSALLDYDVQPVYELEVVVRDGSATEGLSVTGTLTVSLIYDNDQHTLINLPDAVTVDAKGSPAGTQVFDVVVSKETSDQMRYPIISQDPDDGTFATYPNGTVYATRDLGDVTSNQYVLEISAVDTTYHVGPEILTIHLVNLRVPPTVHNLPQTVSVPEDAINAAGIYQVLASDDDGDELTYTFASISPSHGIGRFLINSTTGEVSIIDNPGFDRETIAAQYRLEVLVSDYLYSNVTAVLTVDIANVPEPPVFDPELYYASIPEQQPPDTRVPITLSSRDPDIGDLHTYSILSGPGSDYFKIVDDEVFIKEKIDVGYIAESVTYAFKVLVTDGDGLTDTATLNITVNNINDDIDFVNLPNSVTLDAITTLKETEIFTVELTPTESFDTATCEIADLPAPNDGLFLMEPSTGVIRVTKDLRDHPTASYDIPVTCSDRRGNNVGPETLTVNIVNVRVPPTVDNLPFTVTLPENVASQVDVFRIQASDADNDPIVRYNLISLTPDTDKFIFDASTGLLQTKPSPDFDFETQNSYQAEMSASDYLYESTRHVLDIQIIDVNEPPVFGTTHYTADVNEASPVGTAVTLTPPNFDAVDEDGDTLTYSINPGPFSNHFRISGGGTGNGLEINGNIDTDLGGPDVMTLEIVAQDPGGLQTKASVTIRILDVNDNTPVFQQAVYTATIKENTLGGTSIVTVVATDADPGVNGDITYSVVGDYVTDKTALGDLLFQVDAKSGLVTVKHQADFENHTYVSFDVMATDGGGRTDVTEVQVTIEDVNDYRPTFVKDFFNLETPSYTAVGTHMCTLRATDNDSGLRSTLRYYFLPADNNNYFSLNEDDGRVLTDQSLQNDHSYVLYAFAEDKGHKVKDVKETSTASIVRVDSYDARKYVISIYMSISLEEFNAAGHDHFLEAMMEVLKPWIVKIESVEELESGTSKRRRRRRKRHPHDPVTDAPISTSSGRIRVNIYALRDNITDSVANVEVPKSFVHRNDLLPRLRTNMFGKPRQVLKEGTLAQYAITEVQPKHPIWAIDTLAGILTITACCLLFVALCVGLGVCCCWRLKVCCFKKREKTVSRPINNVPVKPATPLPAVEDDQHFKLNYKANTPQPPANRWAEKRPLSVSSIHTNIVPHKDTNLQRQRNLSPPPSSSSAFKHQGLY